MLAKVIPILAMLVMAIRPLAADPAAVKGCEMVPVDAASEPSANACVPIETHLHRRGTTYPHQGAGSLGDIMGGRGGHARELTKLAYYAANGDRTQVEILSRELSEFGVSGEEIEATIARTGSHWQPSRPGNQPASFMSADGS